MGDEKKLDGAEWTFLSNHAHVLLCIAGEPQILLREVARRVGVTERAVQRIVADLEEGGYLSRVREGRRNHYEVYADLPLRHPVEAHRQVRVLLDLILGPKESKSDALSKAPQRGKRPD